MPSTIPAHVSPTAIANTLNARRKSVGLPWWRMAQLTNMSDYALQRSATGARRLSQDEAERINRVLSSFEQTVAALTLHTMPER